MFGRKKKVKEQKALGRSPEQSTILIENQYDSELMLNGNYETIAKDAFVGNPDGYAVVERVSNSVANLQFRVYQKLTNGDKKYLDNHPVLELLKRPNTERGQYEYIYELVMFFLLSGKMWQRKIDVAGTPQKLFACNPRDMGMYLGRDTQKGWVFDYDGQKKYYEIEEISYVRLPHPLDEFDGLSPLQTAGYAIDGNNESDRWNFSMLKNGARPSGILKTSGKLGEIAFKRLKLMLKGWMGKYNAGKGVILEEGLEWQQLSLTQKDMDNYNYTKLNSRKIAQVLGVPIALIDPDAQTYANYKEANKAFHVDKIIPFGNRIVDEWNNWLMPAYGNDIFIEIDLSQIEALSEDKEKTAKISREDYEGGIITRAEAREKRGLDFNDKDKVYKLKLQDVFQDEKGNITIPAIGVTESDADLELDDVKQLFGEIEWLVKKKENKATISKSAIEKALDSLNPEELHVDVKDLYYKMIAEEGARVLTGVLDLTKEFNLTKRITDYVEENVLENCTTVLDETLRNKLKIQLTEGSANNESISDLRRRLEKVFDDGYFIQTRPNQLEVIARTEALTASSVATQDAYVQSEVVTSQEWITTLDGRERPWHDTLNGQVKKLNEYFVNEEGRLLFPRDPAGSAANVIQCRCSTIPIVEGSKQKFDTIEKKEDLWRSQDKEALKYVDEMKENFDKAFHKQMNNVLKAL